MRKDTFPLSSFAQKICDPIHGFIHLSSCESAVVRSVPFQRLHHIAQLGLTYHVYPGARHTRFEHSLGVMELSSRLFSSIFSYKKECSEDLGYWHQAIRLAALCHDLGHLPFSHTAEKQLLGPKGHEGMTASILLSSYMDEIWDALPHTMRDDVLDLCLSPASLRNMGRELTPWKAMLSQIITDDNFGADRIDYLLRDGYYAGVNFGSFDYLQLMETLSLLKEPEPRLVVESSGIQAVESLWIARYLMYSRLYFHPKVRMYGLQVTRFMKELYADVELSSDIDFYLMQTDGTVLEAIKKEHVNSPLAHALYRGELLFQELSLEGLNLSDEQLEELEQRYPQEVIVDRLAPQAQTRTFPVITPKGMTLLSTEISPFLKEIPYGHNKRRLYCTPRIKESLAVSL